MALESKLIKEIFSSSMGTPGVGPKGVEMVVLFYDLPDIVTSTHFLPDGPYNVDIDDINDVHKKFGLEEENILQREYTLTRRDETNTIPSWANMVTFDYDSDLDRTLPSSVCFTGKKPESEYDLTEGSTDQKILGFGGTPTKRYKVEDPDRIQAIYDLL